MLLRLLALLLLTASAARAAYPGFSSTKPFGGQIGSEFQLTIGGTGLDDFEDRARHRRAQHPRHPCVDLDRHDTTHVPHQFGGQHANARPNLQDLHLGMEVGRRHDAIEDRPVNKQVLTE